MNKIDTSYMIDSFNRVSTSYEEATLNVGLWNSEEDLVKKYTSSNNDKILDMGCGVGRVSFALESMGYTNLTGIDFSPQMINRAKKLKKSTINFYVGDCTCIEEEENTFDFAIFSFNGLMQIPERKNRLKALKELKRVLKPNAYLVFTSHDRDNGNKKYLELWREEKLEWDNNLHDHRLHDFGDVITYDEVDEVEYFIHIPSYSEVVKLIEESGFELVDSFIRSSRYRENKEVYDFSDNCRFWIVKSTTSL